ncbi:MAG: helix-turn-helix domain containing protein [Desulfovibrionaceae bacterium]|nr:helix-turn-helix domain containing protein [Desulfovibrionaceae bacterium]
MVEPSPSHGDTPQSDFVLQYDRILAATGCRTQSDLARVLGIKQAAVSDVTRRKSIPTEWLLHLFEKKGINPEWIRSGAGDCFLHISN